MAKATAVDRAGTAFAADSMVAVDMAAAAHVADIEAIPILDLEAVLVAAVASTVVALVDCSFSLPFYTNTCKTDTYISPSIIYEKRSIEESEAVAIRLRLADDFLLPVMISQLLHL